MSKVKAAKRVVVQDSEESSESQLEQLSKKKPAKQQIVEQKKKAAKKNLSKAQSESEQDETPQVKPKGKKDRKASIDEEEEPVSKDKGKKIVKTSGEPLRKKSLDKTKKKQPVSESNESDSEEPKKLTKKVASSTRPVVKAKGALQASQQQSESDEIIQQPKKKGVSPNVKPGKSPKQVPKSSPKVQSKSNLKVESKGAKKPALASQQQSQESQSELAQKKAGIKKTQGKNMIITQKPANGQKDKTKKASKEESEQDQESSEPQKPVAKNIKDKKKAPVKHIEESEDEESQEVVPKKKQAGKQGKKAVQESDEDIIEEEKPLPKGRKASKDSLKVPGNKTVEDEEGEFELCVQQLSFNAYDSDIRAHFQQCGDILNVKLLTKPDGQSKGTGFVKFGKKSEFNKALQLDGSQLMGRSIKVSEAQNNNNGNQRGNNNFQNKGNTFQNNNQQKIESSAPIQSSTLFIGGLSFQSTQQSMKKFFQQCGQVVGTRIVTDRETGKSRGFGYVEFADIDSAKKAYQQLNGQSLDGRQIRLDSSKPRDRPEGGNRGGYGGGGNRGGYGGDNRGSYGARNPGNSQVDLSQQDRNLKSGAMGTFAGKRVML